MEKWKPTPEGYRELILSMVDLMAKDTAWQRMLGRLYACANELYCTNGYQSPRFNDSENCRAYIGQLMAQSRAALEVARA